MGLEANVKLEVHWWVTSVNPLYLFDGSLPSFRRTKCPIMYQMVSIANWYHHLFHGVRVPETIGGDHLKTVYRFLLTPQEISRLADCPACNDICMYRARIDLWLHLFISMEGADYYQGNETQQKVTAHQKLTFAGFPSYRFYCGISCFRGRRFPGREESWW